MIDTLVVLVSGLRKNDYRISDFERNLCRAGLSDIAISVIQGPG